MKKNRKPLCPALALSILAWPLSALAILPDEPPPEKPKAAVSKPAPKPKPAPKVHRQPRRAKPQAEEPEEEAPRPASAGPCGDCPEMVRIPGGSFMMGASSGEQGSQDDERPRHSVQVEAFALGKYEVTRAQFAAFVDASGHQASGGCYTWSGSEWKLQSDKDWRDPGFSQSSKHPVACVSFNDAQAYIRWLNGKTGRRYRLPTEAEWEYAARAGTDTARYWGDDADEACGYANVGDQSAKRTFSDWTIHNCDDGYVYTAPVGSFSPNRFGLHDMLGNVWEWTCSEYTERYDGSENECINDASARRVNRGGSWSTRPAYVRSAIRYGLEPTARNGSLGFRLAQD
jgi:formylglycine-generating enzyme required for sulfatase activity